MKKNIVLIASVCVLALVALFLFWNKDATTQENQEVLGMTLNLSREYVSLRYDTDTVLLNAREYSSYESWSIDVNKILERWQTLEKESLTLQDMATEMSRESVSYTLTDTAYAYDTQEISNVFDSAPAGKKIATLAKHLGVDAKTAFALLKQDQSQVEADAWNEAGNTFQTLETTATLVKDACKITTFVGTIALTGGTSALAAGSTLGKVAVAVSGADLTLEVTDDAAKIALGNNNKVSTIIGNARVVTEPVAAILMISTLPSNVTGAIDTLGAVTFGAEQLNGTIQEGKVIGIKLPASTGKTGKQKMEVSVLEPSELSEWIINETSTNDEMTKEEVEKILEGNKQDSSVVESTDSENTESVPDSEIKSEDKNEAHSTSNENVVGMWKGKIKFTQSSVAEERSMDFELDIKSNGALGGEASETYDSWTMVDGNLLHLMAPAEEWEGYDEFRLEGNSLTYVKRAGINSEGVWQEDFAGSDFFGGKFMEIYLEKE